MDIFHYDPNNVMSFLLTLFRISIILFMLPFFGGKNIPKSVKGALCIVLSWALWPYLSLDSALFPAHPFGIAVMLLGEAFIGLVLMLIVRFLFAAVQFGGQIIGFQMGFSMINVVDPLTGQQVVITSHFLYMTTLLTFLALNGHLFLLQGLADSFTLVPPGQLFLTGGLGTGVLNFANQMFVLGVKIAAPVTAAIFLVDLALALVGRAAPQMHVLILGFPIKIAVGFFFLGVLFATLSTYVQDYITSMGPMFHQVLMGLSGQ